jgi:hypothetical protein
MNSIHRMAGLLVMLVLLLSNLSQVVYVSEAQTTTVTTTSTITSTVTSYTTVTSSTVTRTVTGTSTIYTTSTTTVDVTSTHTSTQTVATTVTRTTTTTITEQQTQDTTPPTVRVIAPNGGERLSPGSVFTIRWEAWDNVGITGLYIRLYQDGVMRMFIADNPQNTGYYDWTVPNRPGRNYKIVVIARDAAGNFGEDESDGTFEIVAVAQGTLQHFDLDYRGTPLNSDGSDQIMVTVNPCSSLTLFFYYREGNTGSPYIIRVYPEWDKDRFIANSDNNEAAPEGERSREEGGFRWDVETYIVPCTQGTYKVRVVYRGSHTPPTWDSYDKLLAEGTIIVQAVAPSLPDLTVRDVSFSPQTVTQGGSITVSWTEANIGSGNAGPYWVGTYLGLSEYGMDYLLGSFHRDGLAVGVSRGYTQTFMIPSNVLPGIYYVTVFIDSQGDVSERDEGNNIRSSAPNRVAVTKTMQKCEEQVVIIIQLDEEDKGFYETYRIAPGTWGRSSDRPYPSWSHTVDYNLVAWYAFGAYPETGRKAPTCKEKQPLSFHVVVNERERISFLGKSYKMDFSLDLAGFPGDSLTVTLGRTKEDRLIVKKVEPSLVVKTAQDLEITVVRMEESFWNRCGPPFCGGRTYYYTVAVRNKSEDKYQIALMDVGVNLGKGYNWKVTDVEIVKQPDHGGDIKKFLDQLVTIHTIKGFGETLIQFYNLLGIQGIPIGLFTAAAQQALNIPPEPVFDYSDVEHRFAVTLTAHGGQQVPMWLGPREEAHFKFAIQETEYKAGRWIKPVFTATYFEVMHIVKIEGWPDLALWANYIFALNWNEVGQLQVASTRAPQPIPTSSSWSGKTEVKLQENGHKLYLHVYDDLNRHVGYNRETGQVEIGIPGSQYYDHQNGTIVVLLPSGVFISSIRVDAGDAKEPREEYSLVVSTVDGMQVVERKEVRGVIDKGRVVEYRVEASSDGKVVVVTPPPWYVSYWPVFAIAAVAAVAIAFRGRLRTRQRKKLVVRESGKGGELTVIDKLSGRRYTLGIFEENTAKDVIDTLIEIGLIKPTPEEGYQWALTDRSGSVISPAERLSSRLPEREVFLVARPLGGKRSEDRIELTVIHKRAGKRYTLEVFKDNTAGDVIDALIESGLIKPSPGVGYAWALVSPRLEIPYDEKILEALSPGVNEVFLIAKPMGGP